MSNELKKQLWFNYLHRVNQPARRQPKKPKRKIIRKEQPSYVQSNNH